MAMAHCEVFSGTRGRHEFFFKSLATLIHGSTKRPLLPLPQREDPDSAQTGFEFSAIRLRSGFKMLKYAINVHCTTFAPDLNVFGQ